ncbi:MAG: ring-cleaving dioxygenase [Aggregatilineales bacterium]
MSDTISGLHHVTAIAGDPQRNLNFYTGVLGLRLIKLTVNFDDPETYHFYFGNETGNPGTILTFFPIPGAPPGRRGNGQASEVAFNVPPSSFDFWSDRLHTANVHTEHAPDRFGQPVLAFNDPDGLGVELIAAPEADPKLAWQSGPVPLEHAVRGFHSVTIHVEAYERTAELLTNTLGFRLTQHADNRYRYEAGAGGAGATIDVVYLPDGLPGQVSVGSIHHIAWRTPDDASQLRWREKIARLGYNVTPVMDRQYFHSIYFREPGHVLFEIATDTPGFAIDESISALGTNLKLPAQYEEFRAHIEHSLPHLVLPQSTER